MKELLKYQKPKVLVFDVLSSIDNNINSYSIALRNNLGLKFSTNKINSILFSFDKKYHRDVLLEFPVYHNRYKELTKKDFNLFYNDNTTSTHGFDKFFGQKSIEIKDVSGITESKPLNNNNLEYLIKIIALAKINDIQILFIKSPYNLSEKDQMIYNTVDNIAKSSNIPFLNFNLFYKDLGIDHRKDFADDSHFAASGVRKYTHYLTDYLSRNYNLEDKRRNQDYADWNDWAEKALTEWHEWTEKHYSSL
jgi:hypothetical protein